MKPSAFYNVEYGRPKTVGGIDTSPTGFSDASPQRRQAECPLFTIGIPTYNRSEWLKDCVQSALSQSFASFEVIVSDNASTDATHQVLKACSDPRLFTIRQARNIGPIANWNACLAAARGTFIVMLCDDDRLSPNLLEQCSAVIKEDVNIRLVVALADVLDRGSGRRTPPAVSKVLRTGVRHGTEVLLEFLRGRISPAMCTVAMHTETLRARGGFPDGWPHTGDLVSWVPVLLQGSAGFVNEPCGTYCVHDGTQTSRFSLDTRVRDIERLTAQIVNDLDKVADPRLRFEIGEEVGGYLARHCIGHLTDERRSGASRRDIMSAAWSWRHCVSGTKLADLSTLARFFAIFLLPQAVIPPMRAAKQKLQSWIESGSRQ